MVRTARQLLYSCSSRTSIARLCLDGSIDLRCDRLLEVLGKGIMGDNVKLYIFFLPHFPFSFTLIHTILSASHTCFTLRIKTTVLITSWNKDTFYCDPVSEVNTPTSSDLHRVNKLRKIGVLNLSGSLNSLPDEEALTLDPTIPHPPNGLHIAR